MKAHRVEIEAASADKYLACTVQPKTRHVNAHWVEIEAASLDKYLTCKVQLETRHVNVHWVEIEAANVDDARLIFVVARHRTRAVEATLLVDAIAPIWRLPATRNKQQNILSIPVTRNKQKNYH